jgi:fumarylacetoacetase
MHLNETHDPARKSWVESANRPNCDFPIQNLPFGVFRPKGESRPHIGVAIGNRILDLAAAGFGGTACRRPTLNALAALGRPAWHALRLKLSHALSKERGWQERKRRLERHLVPISKAQMLLPLAIGNYTDFYTSLFHATNVGRIFRPDNPLLPNFKWLPIAYHGRASSVVVSGTPIRRPLGQTKSAEADAPAYGPSKRLDYEAELALVIGPGNALGHPIRISHALEHVLGMVLLNDWSARDLQAWEYQPLGPFLGKSFGTTVSPWIVTLEALAPFRSPAYWRPEGDPRPLPHLYDPHDQTEGSYSIEVQTYVTTARMRAARASPHLLSRCDYGYSYWTPAQMVAHHASNGCDLRPGDLLGTGTISGPNPDTLGSLIELTQGGKQPLALPGGEQRLFLEDGDEVIERASCSRTGCVPIGFGEARGVVHPAPAP